MKKRLMAVCVFSVISSSAMADNSGTLELYGVVSQGTCNISPVSGGGVSGNSINLGTVGTGQTASPVAFSLQPDKDCAAGAGAGAGAAPGTQVSVNFNGQFDESGLKPTSGTATNSRVKLTAVNAATANTDINKTNSQASFNLTDLNHDGAKISATLVGGNIPGDYHSNVTYSVFYK